MRDGTEVGERYAAGSNAETCNGNKDGTAHLDRYKQTGRLCPRSLLSLFRQGSVQKVGWRPRGTGRKRGQEFVCDGDGVSGGKDEKVLEMGGGEGIPTRWA